MFTQKLCKSLLALMICICLGLISSSLNAGQTKSNVNQSVNDKLTVKYAIKMREKVYKNLTKLTPKQPVKFTQCKVGIKLSETGVVLDAAIEESSGSQNIDELFLLAIRKSSPLPLPKDPIIAQQFRDFTMVLR